MKCHSYKLWLCAWYSPLFANRFQEAATNELIHFRIIPCCLDCVQKCEQNAQIVMKNKNKTQFREIATSFEKWTANILKIPNKYLDEKNCAGLPHFGFCVTQRQRGPTFSMKTHENRTREMCRKWRGKQIANEAKKCAHICLLAAQNSTEWLLDFSRQIIIIIIIIVDFSRLKWIHKFSTCLWCSCKSPKVYNRNGTKNHKRV